ncbi:MAG: acyltransferase family protein [Capsulimonadaceae bacterium]
MATSTQQVESPGDNAPVVRRASGVERGWIGILDAVRGAAAVYVVLNHASVLLFVGHHDASSLGAPLITKLLALFVLVFAFGHQAVVVFFVLSGFCIHFRQATTLTSIEGLPGGTRDFKFDYAGYLKRRARRIVPPFYAALLFTAGVDALSRFVNPAFQPHLTGVKLADEILTQHNDMQTLLGNVVFLQWLKFPTYGDNTPLWSLAYEFWLYTLYLPLLAGRIRFGIGKTVGTVAVVSVAAFLLSRWMYVWPLAVLSYWLCWAVGALTAEIYVKRITSVADASVDESRLARRNVEILVCFLGAVIWLGAVRLVHVPPAVLDTAGSFVAGLFLLIILSRRASPGPVMRSLGRVGTFSYSLYLTHVPLLCLLCSIWFRTHTSMPFSPLLLILGVAGAVAVGWTSYYCVERHWVR